MADRYLDTPKKLTRALRYWRGCAIKDGYISLEKAVSTINTPDRIVEARQDFPGRWVVSLTSLLAVTCLTSTCCSSAR